VTAKSWPLAGNVHARVLLPADAEQMAAAYLRNRDHLAPWEPERPEDFFTVAGQNRVIGSKMEQHAAGGEVPFVLVDGVRVVGALTITGVVRGPFLSAHLGYWVDGESTGRGIGSAAVAFAIGYARHDLGLHRLQAATLLHNAASQKVLKGSGFTEIGRAPEYLKIAGTWQDHILFQRLLF